MGGSKPLRSLGRRTLLEHALDHARLWSDRVAVAAREDRQVDSSGVPVIRDQPEVEGPLGGLIAGLNFAREQNCGLLLTIPADMPFLPDDLLERLAGALRQEVGAALASSGGHVHPVCGLWRVDALEAADDYAANGQRSLKGLAAAIGSVPVEWPAEPLDPFFNINSADELAAAERLLRIT